MTLDREEIRNWMLSYLNRGPDGGRYNLDNLGDERTFREADIDSILSTDIIIAAEKQFGLSNIPCSALEGTIEGFLNYVQSTTRN